MRYPVLRVAASVQGRRLNVFVRIAEPRGNNGSGGTSGFVMYGDLREVGTV
jgi:hypothetical protein